MKNNQSASDKHLLPDYAQGSSHIFLKNIKRILFLLIIFIVLLGCYSKNTFIDKKLYDSWYERQPVWLSEPKVIGKGYKGTKLENRARGYAWGWGYYGNSLIDMYKATGDIKYLRDFIPQANYILDQRDHILGIESFSGSNLSLPVWSDDRGYFSTTGAFVYSYPVHTGMIILPIVRFIDVVKENSLTEFVKDALYYTEETKKTLLVHNEDGLWKDISENKGFYYGHLYGEGKVTEAGKEGIPNRIFIYLAAAGLFDKVNDSDIFTDRIEKSLTYFKEDLMKHDPDNDSYYWSYWECSGEDNWEDISHAALTVYGIHILHYEADFEVFNLDDFIKFSNIVNKIISVKDKSNPQVSRLIHPRSDDEYYFEKQNNPYFVEVGRWSFLGRYNPDIYNKLDTIFEYLYGNDELPEDTVQTRLNQVSNYLYSKE